MMRDMRMGMIISLLMVQRNMDRLLMILLILIVLLNLTNPFIKIHSKIRIKLAKLGT